MDYLEIIIRLVSAGLIGGVIGLEREIRAKEAGVRTHFLVAVGSALFMIISQYGFASSPRFDAARVAAQVVSGIGFIGAGTIIFQKNVVRGLTTAAGLWVTAAIGLACGGGLYVPAVVTALLAIACLELMQHVLQNLGEKTVSVSFSSYDKEDLRNAMKTLKAQKIEIQSFAFSRFEAKNGPKHKISMTMKVKREDTVDKLYNLINSLDGVTVESIE